MSHKIVMYGHGGSGNHGCEAIIKSTDLLFNRNCVVCSANVEEDIKYGFDKFRLIQSVRKLNQTSVRRYYYAIRERMSNKYLARYGYIYEPLLRSIDPRNVYLSVGGDHYCYGVHSNYIYNFLNEEIKRKGSKTVLWSCSVDGENLDSESISGLNLYDLITVRESISISNLREAGVKSRIIRMPDVAFALPPLKQNLPSGFIPGKTIGVNASPMIFKYGNKDHDVYFGYVNLIERILQETSCNVALIPHVVWSDSDDRVVLDALKSYFSGEDRVFTVLDSDASSLKYLISQCSFFIGARTHSTIAAFSSGVPVLTVGYSVKAFGIASDLYGSVDDYVVSAQRITSDDILADAFTNLWKARDVLSTHLRKKLPNYRNEILLAKDEVLNLLS